MIQGFCLASPAPEDEILDFEIKRVQREAGEPEEPPAEPRRRVGRVRSGDEEGAAEEDGCTKQPCRGGCFAAEASP